MPRTVLVRFALLGVVLAVLAGLHLYVADRLIFDPEIGGAARIAALALLAALGLSLVAAPIAQRRSPGPVARAIAFPAYLWLGVGLLLLVSLAFTDLLLWGLGSVAFAAEGEPTDDLRLAAARAGLVTFGVGIASIVAVLNALRGPKLVRHEVELSRADAALDGFRIVQISDIHIGPVWRRAFAESITRRVNALAPDLVAVTGDLVDGSVAELGRHVRPFAKLEGRHGVYFVTGNHDHYSGASDWAAFVSEMGIRVLRNERVHVDAGGRGFDLAGVDDYRGGYAGSSHDLARALAGRDPETPVILLAHDPSSFGQAARAGVDLQLSGHTHGGQIWPFRYFVRLANRFVAGFYARGKSRLYVSRGTGTWGPPMRLFAPAEITELTLRAPSGRSPDAVPAGA